MIKAVAAIDSERGIATEDGIPWDIPTDKLYYANLIKNSIVLMGKNTYETHPVPLSNKVNLVMTSDPALRQGFEKYQADTLNADDDIAVIGGEGVFREMLPFCQELHLTIVNGVHGCTKHFPEFEQDFVETSHTSEYSENGHNYAFTIWERKKSP